MSISDHMYIVVVYVMTSWLRTEESILQLLEVVITEEPVLKTCNGNCAKATYSGNGGVAPFSSTGRTGYSWTVLNTYNGYVLFWLCNDLGMSLKMLKSGLWECRFSHLKKQIASCFNFFFFFWIFSCLPCRLSYVIYRSHGLVCYCRLWISVPHH